MEMLEGIVGATLVVALQGGHKTRAVQKNFPYHHLPNGENPKSHPVIFLPKSN